MVRSILLVQSSFTGKNLQSIPHVYLRYVSKVDGNELSRFPFVPTVPFGCGSPLTEQLSRTTRFAFGLVVNKSVAYAFEECIDFHSAESNRLKTLCQMVSSSRQKSACLDSAVQAPVAFEVFFRFLIFISTQTVPRLFFYYFTFFSLARYRT